MVLGYFVAAQMTGIAIRAFRGTVPKTSSRLLAYNQANYASNCKITSGRLDPLKGLGLVHTSTADLIETMYRYRFGAEYNWLVWGRTVDVARSPVAQDSLGRFYFTGDGEPRMSTYADAISGSLYPDAWYVLGVTPPVTAMAITVVGGAAANEDRAYVYTYVTQYGEESGPSPALLKTGRPDGSWNISLMDAAPPNSGTMSAAVADTPLTGQVTVTLNTVFGLAAYEEVTFASVAGMTDLNGTFALVSVDSGTNTVVVTLSTVQVYSAAADTWTRVAPHNTTGMVKRIYRTIGTGTDYKYVAEVAVATTTYSDTIPSATVSLNNGIPTLNTLVPLKDMHSLALLANGALAGISQNQVCFSEVGKPYSWPLANRYTFPGTGVALCAAGNAAIILTDNFPYVATATVPEAASVSKVSGDTLAPCVAKRGMVDIDSGAIYPSNDGLYVVTTSGARNITESLYTFDEWQGVMPETFKAGFQDSRYYAMHDSATVSKMFVLHTNEPDSIIEVEKQVDSLYANPWDGKLYASVGSTINQWDSDDDNRLQMLWQSHDHQLGKPVGFTVAQVHAKYEDIQPVSTVILDANIALIADVNNVAGEIATFEVGTTEIAGSQLMAVPNVTENSVQFTLYQDGVAVYTKDVMNNKAFKLPQVGKSDLYSVQVTGTIPVYSINIAQGVDELKQAAV